MSERIILSGPTDFAGFREAARRLLARGVRPQDVEFHSDAGDDLFSAPAPSGDPPRGQPRAVPTVPRSFLDTAGSAILHRTPDRFALVYRLLWRIEDEPGLLGLASDPDVMRLADLARAVRRDIHKMHAFVRFRSVTGPDEREAFVAWYEPDHHIVAAAAPFFAKRFASLLWTILTPELSVHWTGEQLVTGPGVDRSQAPDGDRLEDLWRSYYASVFNPARVNPDAMRAEMPVRFWRNLPEASLIGQLVANAPARAQAMIAAAPTLPVRRRGAEMADTDKGRGEAQPGDATVDLKTAVDACRNCALWEHATQGVPGEGPTSAALLIVGEQPGDEEDLAGRPFVGPAGRLLDKALAEAGVGRSGVYVTNAVKHFKFEPRGKRRIHKKPEAREIHACLPWLEREIATVRPRAILMLGATAAQAVLGRTVPVMRMRGQVLDLPGGHRGLIATHPSYILRLPDREAAKAAYDALVRDLAAAWRLAIGKEPENDPRG